MATEDKYIHTLKDLSDTCTQSVTMHEQRYINLWTMNLHPNIQYLLFFLFLGIFRHWDSVENNKQGRTWHMLSLGASRTG
jgi:hypothetical protein